MKKIFYISSAVVVASTPFVSFASSQNLNDLVYKIIGYLNQALVLLMGVAVLVFVWNVIKYFIMSTEDHKAAAPYVMWSIIGFFVVLSFWGLVNVLQNTFGLGNNYNQPQSWTQISNIFPQSGGTSSGSSNNGMTVTTPAGTAGSMTATTPAGTAGTQSPSLIVRWWNSLTGQ